MIQKTCVKHTNILEKIKELNFHMHQQVIVFYFVFHFICFIESFV